jgi:hypothetical protein
VIRDQEQTRNLDSRNLSRLGSFISISKSTVLCGDFFRQHRPIRARSLWNVQTGCGITPPLTPAYLIAHFSVFVGQSLQDDYELAVQYV